MMELDCTPGVNAEFLNVVAAYQKYSYREDDMVWGCVMVVLCMVLIVFCFLLNGVVLDFYFKRREEVVCLIYSLLSIADVVVGVGSCLTVTCLVVYLCTDTRDVTWDYVAPQIQYLCYLAFFVSTIAIRASIFLNLVLTVVRTLMIRNPFYVISKRGIMIAITVYLTVWIVLTTGEAYTVKAASIDIHWQQFARDAEERKVNMELCSPDYLDNRKQQLYMWYYIFTTLSGFYAIVELFGDKLSYSLNITSKEWNDPVEVIVGFAMMLVTYIIPTIIAITCLVLQAVSLERAKVEGVVNNNKQVTVTIILLTTVFVVCNTATLTFTLVAYYSEIFKGGGTDGYLYNGDTIRTFYWCVFFCQQVLPLVNSTFNSMILIWRGTGLRRRFWDVLGFAGKGVVASAATVTIDIEIKEEEITGV